MFRCRLQGKMLDQYYQWKMTSWMGGTGGRSQGQYPRYILPLWSVIFDARTWRTFRRCSDLWWLDTDHARWRSTSHKLVDWPRWSPTTKIAVLGEVDWGRSTALYSGEIYKLSVECLEVLININSCFWLIQMLVQSGVCALKHAPPSLSPPLYATSSTVHCSLSIVHRWLMDGRLCGRFW